MPLLEQPQHFLAARVPSTSRRGALPSCLPSPSHKWCHHDVNHHPQFPRRCACSRLPLKMPLRAKLRAHWRLKKTNRLYFLVVLLQHFCGTVPARSFERNSQKSQSVKLKNEGRSQPRQCITFKKVTAPCGWPGPKLPFIVHYKENCIIRDRNMKAQHKEVCFIARPE